MVLFHILATLRDARFAQSNADHLVTSVVQKRSQLSPQSIVLEVCGIMTSAVDFRCSASLSET